MLSVYPKIRIFVQDQAYGPEGHAKKISTPIKNLSGQARICLIFRGLFFERNAGIGQKDHLWLDTSLECIFGD